MPPTNAALHSNSTMAHCVPPPVSPPPKPRSDEIPELDFADPPPLQVGHRFPRWEEGRQMHVAALKVAASEGFMLEYQPDFESPDRYFKCAIPLLEAIGGEIIKRLCTFYIEPKLLPCEENWQITGGTFGHSHSGGFDRKAAKLMTDELRKETSELEKWAEKERKLWGNYNKHIRGLEDGAMRSGKKRFRESGGSGSLQASGSRERAMSPSPELGVGGAAKREDSTLDIPPADNSSSSPSATKYRKIRRGPLSGAGTTSTEVQPTSPQTRVATATTSQIRHPSPSPQPSLSPRHSQASSKSSSTPDPVSVASIKAKTKHFREEKARAEAESERLVAEKEYLDSLLQQRKREQEVLKQRDAVAQQEEENERLKAKFAKKEGRVASQDSDGMES